MTNNFEKLITRIRAMLSVTDSIHEIRNRLIVDYTDEEIFLAYKAAIILNNS